ncbi:MAG: AbrB/MazE/SpoVT family DNA-binding domain-containing protein [Trichodesmium sp.]
MKAIETNGKIDKNGNLILDNPLEINTPTNVRVIILLEESENQEIETDKTEEANFEKAMNAYQKISEKYRNALRKLAQ